MSPNEQQQHEDDENDNNDEIVVGKESKEIPTNRTSAMTSIRSSNGAVSSNGDDDDQRPKLEDQSKKLISSLLPIPTSEMVAEHEAMEQAKNAKKHKGNPPENVSGGNGLTTATSDGSDLRTSIPDGQSRSLWGWMVFTDRRFSIMGIPCNMMICLVVMVTAVTIGTIFAVLNYDEEDGVPLPEYPTMIPSSTPSSYIPSLRPTPTQAPTTIIIPTTNGINETSVTTP